jgi:hypothetical protein
MIARIPAIYHHIYDLSFFVQLLIEYNQDLVLSTHAYILLHIYKQNPPAKPFG